MVNINKVENSLTPENKPLLVYVNPHSGSGKAKVIFQERILPVWAEAGITYKLVHTSKYYQFLLK